MGRPVIRSIEAQRNLDVLLAFAIAGVLANRFFLVITGYPQLGGGTLHISHAIWGGLMMVIAAAAAVSVITPGVRLFVAVVGGAGFGWFVDELGKFITREACDPAGRPVYAANASLPRPDDPHLRLWHAATLLREHRGDGHVAALTAAGLDACEAHVTRVAAAGVALDTIQPYRGWADDDWRRAARRLADRGWIDAAGRLTAAGRSARDAVEADTDRLAAAPVERLGAERLERLADLLAPLVAPLIERGTIPYPNPIGVPRPH